MSFIGDAVGGLLGGGGGGGGSSSQQAPSSSSTTVVQGPQNPGASALFQLAGNQSMQGLQAANPFGQFGQQLLQMSNQIGSPQQFQGIGAINSPSAVDLAASVTAQSVHARQLQAQQFGF